MKILITGSSGYVGYILSKFFSEKKIKVVGLDLTKNRVWKENDYFKFYACDITNKKKLEEIFKKEQPTHIIHLAFLMQPLHDITREHEIDVTGSKYAIQIANQTKSVKQFIKFSSASTYGAWPENELWIKEDYPLRPRDYRYGINKKKVEEFYDQYKKRNDLKLVIFRMCTAIGPIYHKKGGVVSLLVNAPLLTKSDKKHYEVQFLHEDDLNSLTELVIQDKEVEGVFNLAPDSYATLKELAPNKLFLPIPLWLLRGLIGILWFLRIVDIRPAAITLSTYGIIVDPKKIMDRYHYKFKYSTKTAFKQTVEERKKRGTL